MNFKLITFTATIVIIISNMGMQPANTTEALNEEGSNTLFKLATTAGLTQQETCYLKLLNASIVLPELFNQEPRKKKKFYKNIVFGKKPIDGYRINIAIDVFMPTIPKTIQEFKSLSLERIKSNELKQRLTRMFFSRLYGVWRISNKNEQQLGFDIEKIIFSYISFANILNSPQPRPTGNRSDLDNRIYWLPGDY